MYSHIRHLMLIWWFHLLELFKRSPWEERGLSPGWQIHGGCCRAGEGVNGVLLEGCGGNLWSKHVHQVLFTRNNKHILLGYFPLIKTMPSNVCWEPQALPRDERHPAWGTDGSYLDARSDWLAALAWSPGPRRMMRLGGGVCCHQFVLSAWAEEWGGTGWGWSEEAWLCPPPAKPCGPRTSLGQVTLLSGLKKETRQNEHFPKQTSHFLSLEFFPPYCPSYFPYDSCLLLFFHVFPWMSLTTPMPLVTVGLCSLVVCFQGPHAAPFVAFIALK